MTESDEVADGPLSEKLELSATIRDGSEDGKGDGHYRGRMSLIVVAYDTVDQMRQVLFG